MYKIGVVVCDAVRFHTREMTIERIVTESISYGKKRGFVCHFETLAEGDILRTVDEMNEMFGSSCIQMNSVGTKILMCTSIKADVYIGSQKLDREHEMVYLGSKITSDGNSIQEINQCIVLVNTAFSENHKT